MTTEEKDERREEYKLEKFSELRFEVESKENVNLELCDGLAEVFGTELAKNRRYDFQSGSKVAVFTWHGCTIKLSGKTEVSYVSKETPMVMYVNTHAAMEQMREKAELDNSRGPRVLVVGPTDVGKSTLCKILCNYSVRLNRAPVFVDLDVGQTQIGIPGTLGAIVVERPADVEEGFSMTAPLCFHYGHKSPSENLTLFNLLVSRLADVVNLRCESSNKVNLSGVIINTGGWIRGGGYESLKHTAGSFEVDAVIVLGQERLYNEMKRDMPDFVKVILLPKSGGVVERSNHVRAESRDCRIREYFYGITNNLYPATFEMKFADVKIFKIGAPPLPESCLPLGMKAQDNKTKLVPLMPSNNILHHVLSINSSTTIDQNMIEANTLGFIVVTGVNMEKGTFHVLSPAGPPLPNTNLFVMDIQFMDIK